MKCKTFVSKKGNVKTYTHVRCCSIPEMERTQGDDITSLAFHTKVYLHWSYNHWVLIRVYILERYQYLVERKVVRYLLFISKAAKVEKRSFDENTLEVFTRVLPILGQEEETPLRKINDWQLDQGGFFQISSASLLEIDFFLLTPDRRKSWTNGSTESANTAQRWWLAVRWDEPQALYELPSQKLKRLNKSRILKPRPYD